MWQPSPAPCSYYLRISLHVTVSWNSPPSIGDLYWPRTWRQLYHFSLDRPVIDPCGRLPMASFVLLLICFPLASIAMFLASVVPPRGSWALVFLLPPGYSSLYSLFPFISLPFLLDELLCMPNVSLFHARKDDRFRDLHPCAIVTTEDV